MKRLVIGIVASLSLSACGGGGGGGSNGGGGSSNAVPPSEPISVEKFFDESWIEPGNGWWLRTHRRVWPYTLDSWGDYIMGRVESFNVPYGQLVAGDTRDCDISGQMLIMAAEQTDHANYYYRANFQDCVLDATVSSSLDAPPFEPPPPIKITVNGIMSQRKQRLSVEQGTQYKSTNGFEEVHLTLPSLSPEKSSDTFVVSTSSPYESSRTEQNDGKTLSQEQGTMSVTRGNETIDFVIQNKQAIYDTDYETCGISEYSADEVSINSNLFGTLSYNYSDQVPAGEPTNDGCFYPGLEYQRQNTPYTLHPDYLASKYDLGEGSDRLGGWSDGSSQFNFTHSDGSRMRLTSTPNDRQIKVEVDKDGDGRFEIQKAFSDQEYLSTMQLMKKVKRQVKSP